MPAPHAPTAVNPAPRWLTAAAAVSWRLLVVGAAAGLVTWVVSRVRLMFVALFLALVFTAVLRPLVNALSRVMRRSLATVVGLLTGFAALAAAGTYVVASVADQWADLASKLGAGVNQIVTFASAGPPALRGLLPQLNGGAAGVRAWVGAQSAHVAANAASHAGTALQGLTTVTLAVFCTVFFLARGSQMWAWFLGMLPNAWRDGWSQAAHAGWDTFSGYTRGTVLVALSDSALAFVLLEVLHVPLAAPLAVLVLVGAFVPLVGAPAAMLTAVVVALAANGPWVAAGVGVAIAVIGQIEGHVLQPLIVGKQVSLHPVAVALAVTAGTLTAGILGAVIAVPLVAVGWAMYRQLTPASPDAECTPEAGTAGQRTRVDGASGEPSS